MSQGISVFLQPGEMPTGVWGDVCGRSYVQDILGPFFVFVNVDICCSVAKLCSTLCNPMDCSQPGSFVHRIFRQGYWSGLPFLPLGDRPDPEIEPRSLASKLSEKPTGFH